jgi:hypothetical protein
MGDGTTDFTDFTDESGIGRASLEDGLIRRRQPVSGGQWHFDGVRAAAPDCRHTTWKSNACSRPYRQIVDARPEHVPFIARVMLTAARSHVKRGIDFGGPRGAHAALPEAPADW